MNTIMFTTKNKFTVNGEYVRERDFLHQEIVSSLITSESVENPDSFLMGGGSASGKSWATKLILQAYKDEEENVTLIDSDKVKEMLPEYHELVISDPENMALILHDESSDISEKIVYQCINDRRSFIYDGTMKNYEKYLDIVHRLRENNYTVNAYAVDVPIDIALQRNELRFKIEQRKVPEDVLIESHKMFVKTFLRLRKEFDNYRLFDTSETDGSPDLVAEKNKDESENVLNVDKFIKFCIKYLE